jgi:hypothetical protein
LDRELIARNWETKGGVKVPEVRELADEFGPQTRVRDEFAVAVAPGAFHKAGNESLFVMHGTSVLQGWSDGTMRNGHQGRSGESNSKNNRESLRFAVG